MVKRFKELLLNIHSKDMNEQSQILDQEIEKWKKPNDKEYEQVDDILIIGFEM